MRGGNGERDVPLDESQTSVSEEPEYVKAACAAAQELGEACSGPAVCRTLQVLPGHQRKQALCQPEINDSREKCTGVCTSGLVLTSGSIRTHVSKAVRLGWSS